MTQQQYAAAILDDAAVQDFAARLRGELIQPGDVVYDEARKVYNGMIDRQPALIARCVDVADVIGVVTFAREHQLTLAVRGGGHNGAAFSFRDASFAEMIVGVDPDPANNERMIAWAKDYWLALHPNSAGGPTST
jgi:hypothetical protein